MNATTLYLFARLSCLSLCLSSSLSETESDSLSVAELSPDDDDDDELLEQDELESDAMPVSSLISTESATFVISGRCFYSNRKQLSLEKTSNFSTLLV